MPLPLDFSGWFSPRPSLTLLYGRDVFPPLLEVSFLVWPVDLSFFRHFIARLRQFHPPFLPKFSPRLLSAFSNPFFSEGRSLLLTFSALLWNGLFSRNLSVVHPGGRVLWRRRWLVPPIFFFCLPGHAQNTFGLFLFLGPTVSPYLSGSHPWPGYPLPGSFGFSLSVPCSFSGLFIFLADPFPQGVWRFHFFPTPSSCSETPLVFLHGGCFPPCPLPRFRDFFLGMGRTLRPTWPQGFYV